MNETTAQLLAVAIIVGVCIVWVIRRLASRRHGTDNCCEDNSCTGCPLKDNCKK